MSAAVREAWRLLAECWRYSIGRAPAGGPSVVRMEVEE